MLDLHRGLMTWRRLRVILQHLPAESHTMTALRNALPDEELDEHAERGEPKRARWSQLELLMASAVDAVRRVEYVLICSNTEHKRDQPPPPEPIARPGATPRRVREGITDEDAEALFQLINGGAA